MQSPSHLRLATWLALSPRHRVESLTYGGRSWCVRLGDSQGPSVVGTSFSLDGALDRAIEAWEAQLRAGLEDSERCDLEAASSVELDARDHGRAT